MLSKGMAVVINHLPEKIVVKCSKKIVRGYIKKYARINVKGIENIDKAPGAKIFVCNHLSNSDALILDQILKKYDPTFVAGVKLSQDPITSLGTKIVKHINIHPNSADKAALTNIVKLLRNGENLMIFPEGTRSRSGSMIEGKKGVVMIARMSKASIIPISIWGSEKLLPINKEGEMGQEKWNHAEVNVKIGEAVSLPHKLVDEKKHQYDDRCLEYIMKEISFNLPEEYKGIYK